NAGPGARAALPAPHGPSFRSGGPGRHRPWGPRLLPPVRRCVPRPSVAVATGGSAEQGGAGMKAADARVLLTGAAGGIGQAVASALATAGSAMLLAGRSPARLAAQVRTLRERAPATELAWGQADLRDAGSVETLAARARA